MHLRRDDALACLNAMDRPMSTAEVSIVLDLSIRQTYNHLRKLLDAGTVSRTFKGENRYENQYWRPRNGASVPPVPVMEAEAQPPPAAQDQHTGPGGHIPISDLDFYIARDATWETGALG